MSYDGLSTCQSLIRRYNAVATLHELKEFKKEISSIDISYKEPQEIADKLSKIIPKYLETKDIVRNIFEKCRKDEIGPLLDAVCIINKSYVFSGLEAICKAFAEDKNHHLTNNVIIENIKKYELEEFDAIYEYAFKIQHPHIYQIAPQPVLPHEYSLNFLWVNQNPQDRIKNEAEHIFKDGLDQNENHFLVEYPQALRQLEENKKSLENWNQIKDSFAYKISKWADVNPGTTINVWYDSALVTERAKRKTFTLMNAIARKRGVDIKLRDIRLLPNIKTESGDIENSLHPGTPVFYRVDLLKALIADYLFDSTQDPGKYFVISDNDIEPMSAEHLFDKLSLNYLSQDGYVFNGVGRIGFENSFVIFNREKENLKKTHYEAVIKKMEEKITEQRIYKIDVTGLVDHALGSQSVFSLYKSFTRYGELAPRKIVKCPPSQFNEPFTEKSHQQEKFRFWANDPVPYTRNGRNYGNGESQIKWLKDWKAIPV